MPAEWVVEVIMEAMHRHGKPLIMNSDQGSQFTSDLYIKLLKDNEMNISMHVKPAPLTIFSLNVSGAE